MSNKTTTDPQTSTRSWVLPKSAKECANEIVRLRCGLENVLKFLKGPEWGKINYMEGSAIYDDKDQAIWNAEYALGRKPDAE